MDLSLFVDWIRNNTNGLTEAIRLGLYMFLGFGALRTSTGEPWTDAQVALVLSFVSALLSLVAAKTTVSAHKVSQRVDKARAEGVEAGVQQASSSAGMGGGG